MTQELEAKQARTEARLDSLTTDVAQLVNSIDKLSQSVHKGFSEIYERINAQGKINWAPISTGVSVIIAFTSLVFMFYSRDLGRQERAIDELTGSRIASIKEEGKNEVFHEWIKADLTTIDHRLEHLENK